MVKMLDYVMLIVAITLRRVPLAVALILTILIAVEIFIFTVETTMTTILFIMMFGNTTFNTIVGFLLSLVHLEWIELFTK
jgi:hypothetical protein